MGFPRLGNCIDAIRRLDAMLEYAVQHNEPEETDRIRCLLELTERI